MVILASWLLMSATTEGQNDWPQLHEPDRDNKSSDKGLLKTWPEGGPSRLWEAAGIGEGYSTVAIVGKRIYTTGAIDGDCIITALDMNPRFAKAYYYRGLAYVRKRAYDQTISDYTKAIEINPQFALAYSERGFAYYIKREYDKTWENIRKQESLGLEINPGFLEALQKASGRKK